MIKYLLNQLKALASLHDELKLIIHQPKKSTIPICKKYKTEKSTYKTTTINIKTRVKNLLYIINKQNQQATTS